MSVIVRGQTLVIPRDDRVLGLVPGAQIVTLQGKDYTAMHHDYAATVLLRSLGHEVPAPVLTQYDFPSPVGQAPYQVQKQTVDLMTTAPRDYNLNGLGTGKTRCALWAFDFLKSTGQAHKLVVVAPLSTLRRVWEREIFQVFPHLKCAVLWGPKEKRLKILASDADVYVINHDGIQTVLEEITARSDIDALVLDELSVYRNGQAARTKTMRKFAANKRWVWGLTGSPTTKSVTDIWGQAIIVTPHTVPKYFNHLRQDLCYKAGPFKWEPKDDAVERAYSMLQPSCRYTLDDVVELPEVVYQQVEVPLGVKQEQVYKQMAQNALAMVGGQTLDAMNAGAVMSKLLQIALGWVYTRDGAVIELDNQERIAAIIEYAEAADRKVIIFAPFKSAMAGIGKALEEAGFDYCMVSGETPAKRRNEYFTAFQDTLQYKVLLGHPAVMAHGLTLHAADTIIWAGPVTSLEIFQQACGRIRRIGQKHKQLIVMLGGTKVEKRVYTLLAKNETVQNQLLNLLSSGG